MLQILQSHYSRSKLFLARHRDQLILTDVNAVTKFGRCAAVSKIDRNRPRLNPDRPFF